jgi:YidC/Oxa1 family membrane protein insertase
MSQLQSTLVLANVIEEAFSPLITLFEEIMVFIHGVVGGSWGWAIVGLTILTRAVLVPLTYKQLRSMQELQRHTPEMQKIKERYKEDKQRQQEEIMKFYKENKINPLASCLPFLLQIPVFISLFYMLRTDLKKHICGEQLVNHYNALSLHLRSSYHVLHATNVAHLPSKYVEATGCQAVAPGSGKFLFIPDITTKATGAVLIVLIAVYVGSQIASTLMATASADPNQRRMMLLLPLVIVAFLFRYPAGLLVYWITTNLWTIGQQYFIRRRMGPLTPAVASTAGKGGSGAAGGDGGRGGGGKGGGPGGGGGPGPDGGGSANGKPDSTAPGAKPAKAEPALAGVAGKGSSAPPPPPRRKKKRSGRRR